jgi:hypothetical protein
MKRILQSLFTLALATGLTLTAAAQLPNGSIGPDFTATDIDGVEHTLYDYLDDGYSVILDISATWCGPCWSYHTTGTLEALWEAHGPAGMNGVSEDTTDDLMIFFIEGDDETTLDQLNGGAGSQGDWVTGTYYPIIDDAENIFNAYQCTYYPTMYTICPSRICTETGQASEQAHYDFASTPACSPVTLATDPAINAYLGDLATCSEANVAVRIMNLGTENLMAATIDVMSGGSSLLSEPFEWTGNLDTYAMEDVEVGTISISENTVIDIMIVSANDNEENDGISAEILTGTESSTHIFVDITTDEYPYECTWEITDEGGSVVASGGPYGANTTAAQDPITVSEEAWLPSTGCYTFRYMDGYGDGLFGSQWGGTNGTMEVYSEDNDGNGASIYSYDGSYDVEEAGAAMDVNVVNINDQNVSASFNIYPNPINDFANVNLQLVNATKVTVDVINMLGEVVMVKDFGTLSSGQHIHTLDFTTLGSGIYMINMIANGEVATTKVTLTK